MVVQMYRGNLHAPACERCGEPLVRACAALPFPVTVIYLLMIVILAPLSIPYADDAVVWLSGFGCMIALGLFRPGTRWDFENTFFGGSGEGRVNHLWLQVALLGVMAILFILAIRRDTSRGGFRW